MRYFCIILLLWLVGCGEGDRGVDGGDSVAGVGNYEPVAFEDLEGFWGGDLLGGLRVFLRSCGVVGRGDYELGGHDFFLQGVVRRGDLRESCEYLRDFGGSKDFDARAYIERYFVGLRLIPLGGRSKLTGYYEASIRGSRERSGRYRYPVHGVPKDMVSVRGGAFGRGLPSGILHGRVEGDELKKYYSREEIVGGRMGFHEEVLLWTDDVLSLYRLHIQGSGVVEMDDGTRVRLHYAANNGHGYVSLAKELLERGELRRGYASWRHVGEVLSRYPGREEEILSYNPRYIFFVEGEGKGRGTLGVPLESGYSLAVDTRSIPLGLMVWLEGRYPGTEGGDLRRLVVAQDTGAAIKGFVRGDLFWGEGEEALRLAEGTNGSVGMVMLVPKVWWERMARGR